MSEIIIDTSESCKKCKKAIIGKCRYNGESVCCKCCNNKKCQN